MPRAVAILLEEALVLGLLLVAAALAAWGVGCIAAVATLPGWWNTEAALAIPFALAAALAGLVLWSGVAASALRGPPRPWALEVLRLGAAALTPTAALGPLGLAWLEAVATPPWLLAPWPWPALSAAGLGSLVLVGAQRAGWARADEAGVTDAEGAGPTPT